MTRMLSVDEASQARQDLAEEGYAVLRGVVSPDRLAELASTLNEAYTSAPRFDGGGSISGHLNCFPGRQSWFIYEELDDSGVIPLVREIRAGRRNDIRPTMNWNLPGSATQHYHMDGLYTEDFLVCNVAVVDTNVVNGAIDVLPGSHREYLPFWKYAVRRTYRASTRLEMTAGDVLLRKSMLWHRGMPNHSDRPRPMMAITFGETSASPTPPAEAFEGDIRFYPNWYGTDRGSVVREKVFVKAPFTYATYRFVKSLHGDHGYAKY